MIPSGAFGLGRVRRGLSFMRLLWLQTGYLVGSQPCSWSLIVVSGKPAFYDSW